MGYAKHMNYRIVKTISLLEAFCVGGAILYALFIGDFANEGAILISMPRGIVSLIDLYTGFA